MAENILSNRPLFFELNSAIVRQRVLPAWVLATCVHSGWAG